MVGDEPKFDYAFNKLLVLEGGYVDEQLDPGGATKYGVSLRFLKSINKDIDLDGDVDVNDIRSITLEDSRDIARIYWWDKWKYGQIDNYEIAAKALDFSYNANPKSCNKFMQLAANAYVTHKITVDGKMGPKTLAAINTIPKIHKTNQFMAKFRSQISTFYKNVVKRNPNLKYALKGLLNRAKA